MAELVFENVTAVVVLLLVIGISIALIAFSLGDTKTFEEQKEQSQQILERIQNIVQLVREPDVRIACAPHASGYEYEADVAGAEIAFAGSSGDAMSVIPTLVFQDSHYRDTQETVIDMSAGVTADVAFAGNALKFIGMKSGVPPPLDRHGQSVYTGPLLEKQAVVVNNFSVTLLSLRDFYGFGSCRANVLLRCSNGVWVETMRETFSLGDEALPCDQQSTGETCEKFLRLCGKSVRIELEGLAGSDSCSQKKALFAVDAPKEDGEWDFDQSVTLAFWKLPDGEECWRSRTAALSKQCTDAFVGAYKLSLPLNKIDSGRCVA